MLTIYHNPRCSTSRNTLAIIEEYKMPVTVIEYLKDLPTESELKSLLKKLGMEAKELVRTGEPVFKENYKGKVLSEEEWVKAMIENPKLIQRPIIVKGNKAVLGRPPENVKSLF